MYRVNLLRCFFLLTLLTTLNYTVSAQVMESGIALRGLTGADIRVEELTSFDPVDRLSKEVVLGDVEKLLKKAGLKVLTEEEWLSTPGYPSLRVKINHRKEKNRSYSAFIEISLEQNVILERDQSIHLSTITWMENEPLMGSVAEMGTDIRRYVEILVAQFISDWKDANRKE